MADSTGRYEALLQLGACADGTSPVAETLPRLLQALAGAVECDAIGLWLDAGPSAPFSLAATPSRERVDLPPLLARDHAIALAQTSGPSPIDCAAWDSQQTFPYRWTMAAPVRWRGALRGVLVAFFEAGESAVAPGDAQALRLASQYVALLLANDDLTVENDALRAALAAERERLWRVQVAVRDILEQPELHANLAEVVEAAQALGWRRVVLVLFDEAQRVTQLISAGVPAEDTERLRQTPVPREVWQQFEAGALEDFRISGLYFIPYDLAPDGPWDEDDLLFAPLRLGHGNSAGVLRVMDPADGMRPVPEPLRALDIMAGQAAYIVENARLLASASASAQALADQVEELSMIHRADRELSAHLNVDHVMRLTMDWALRRTGAETGVLALITDDERGLVPLVTMGHIDRARFPHSDANVLPIDHGILGRAVRTGATQWLAEGLGEPDDISFMPEARAVLAVPLAMRGEALGVIALASARLTTFDQQDVSFLERLARRAAVALDNARLYRQSQQMAADMAVLYNASRTISSTLERDEILQRIAQSMTEAVECSSTAIFDYRPELGAVQVLAVYRADAAGTAGDTFLPLNQRVLLADSPAFQMVVEQQHPLVLRVEDPSGPEPDRARMAELGIRATLIVPLVAQDELIGLASLREGRRDRIFTPNEVSLAETLASQAAITLRQSMLFGEVRELERMKSEMIRMASHDLRNPLSSVMLYVDMLEISLAKTGMQDDQRAYISKIDRSLQLMRALIDDLLTLDRIESERETHRERVNLAGLLAEVVEPQAASAALKKHTLSVDCGAGNAAVYGSVTQLRQAIANLLNNAIKYTPDGGTIELSCHVSERRVRVAVQDNGFGIAPERQARLFERFYRAREPGTEHIGGTGLGLNLVKTVVERHGGEVWFESEPGAGSIFGFWLPVADD